MLDPATARSDVLRWGAALLVIVALHGAVILSLLEESVIVSHRPAAPEAVMLDLAPELPPLQEAIAVPPVPALLPPPEPPPTPPTPMAEAVAPQLPVPVEVPPTPPVAAEVSPTLPPQAPPRVVPRPKPKPPPAPRPVVHRSPAPALAEAAAPAAVTSPVATPAQPASRPPATTSAALPGWRGALLARLQAAKRYPNLARSRGDQGVATVTFTMDRSGRVLSVALVRSAGSSLLDEEAEALVHRAEPLPPLPDDVGGASITLTVPISFALR